MKRNTNNDKNNVFSKGGLKYFILFNKRNVSPEKGSEKVDWVE